MSHLIQKARYTKYEVGAKHLFIRITPMPGNIHHGDCLNEDIMNTPWAQPIKSVRIIEAMCDSHQFIDGHHLFHFHDKYNALWTSRTPSLFVGGAEEDPLHWTVIAAEEQPAAGYTSFAALIERLGEIRTNPRMYQQYEIDRVTILDDIINQLIRQRDVSSDTGWSMDVLTYAKA